MTVSYLAFLIVIVIIGLMIALFVHDMTITDRDIAWLAGGYKPEPSQAVIYRAYLSRHVKGRIIGGVIGIVVGIVAIIRWGGADWAISIGVTSTPSNILVWWLGGAIIGTLWAESYRLSRSRTPGIRRAGLDPRPSRPLANVALTARIAAIAAVITGIGFLVIWSDTGAIPGIVFAIIVVCFAEATQWVITNRPRPTTEPAMTVDGRLRNFAGSSLAWLELAGAVLSLGVQLAVWSAHLPQQADLLSAVIALVCFGLLIVTIAALVRSRMSAPRHWQPLPFDDIDDDIYKGIPTKVAS